VGSPGAHVPSPDNTPLSGKTSRLATRRRCRESGNFSITPIDSGQFACRTELFTRAGSQSHNDGFTGGARIHSVTRQISMRTHGYPSWQRRHEAVLQYVLQYPAARNAEIAARTGYSVTHISRIVRASEFSARLRAAMKDAATRAAERRWRT